MPTDEPPTLQYHHPDSPLFSVAYISNDERQSKQREIKLRKEAGTEIITEQESVNGEACYLIYSKKAPHAVMPDFETEAEVLDWLDEHFDDVDIPVLLAVADIFDGILQEKEDQGTPVEFYKQMELEKLPVILDRVQWGEHVPTVGADLLSAFVLAHPMPKANHRTGIGLLDRYLTSIDGTFTMPPPEEDDESYALAADYIYSSKRLILLRRTTPILRWAYNAGYREVERKEGIRIDLHDVDFDQSDHYERYTEQHRSRTREFVEALIDTAGVAHLNRAKDDGKHAFEERFTAE